MSETLLLPGEPLFLHWLLLDQHRLSMTESLVHSSADGTAWLCKLPWQPAGQLTLRDCAG